MPLPGGIDSQTLVLTGSANTYTDSSACTAACTSEAENGHDGTPNGDQGKLDRGVVGKPADPLAGLAAEIAKLSPTDRERLTTMLTERRGDAEERPGNRA